MKKGIQTLAELEAEASSFARALRPRGSGATLVTLSGELGAGKTAFTKAAARTLGVEGVVNSPTFVLEKIYALPEGAPFARLIHIDAYRLESEEDLAALGFDEIMEDSANLVFFEWPERAPQALSAPAARITLVAEPGGVRAISYD